MALRWRWLSLTVLLASIQSSAATVVYIDRKDAPPVSREQFATAAAFYGLEMRTVVLESSSGLSAATDAILKPDTVAVVLSAEALGMLPREQVFAAMRNRSTRMPLLIEGIQEQMSSSLLKVWSSGAITACRRSGRLQADSSYEIAGFNEVTRQLAGSRLPLRTRDTLYLEESGAGRVQPIMAVRLGDSQLPIFARTSIGTQEVFFASARARPEAIPVTADPYRQQAVFASIAAPMMFLRYAAGERGWHSPGDYANFTIDDLWLRQSYGHVNFANLLHEAQQHNFHATVAFIPWNFDRSQPQVASLFRDHPDRLSLCVHGNNHVHQEFGPLETHPLATQASDMRQGLARMNRLTQLTEIPYDPVMVFPHSIAPEATFAALKREGYLATVNSLNVPSDAKAPVDTEFALRTGTLQFATFPSLRRYSVETEIPRLQLAIDAFLGNPMLFYAHESFFATGGDAFDKTADLVNTIQPDTKWRGLGDVVQHLYLERREDDGTYAIRSLSPSIRIANNHGRETVFRIQKAEDFTLPLAVLVNGQPYPSQRSGAQLQVDVHIAQGSSSLVEVRYGDAVTPAAVNISKRSPYIATVRLLSDFRDNVVSTTSLGRHFIRSYVAFGRQWNLALCFGALAGFVLLFTWYLRKDRRQSFAASSPSIAAKL